jgi:hypothetical protein
MRSDEGYRANEEKLVALAKTNYATDLTEGELRIIHDSVRPGWVRHGDDKGRETRHARAGFFEWLINSGMATSVIYKDGLRIEATTIDGDLDLDNSHVPYNLVFECCTFTNRIHFIWATSRSIAMRDCTCQGDLNFQAIDMNGDLDLDGVNSHGSIMMHGTQIAGDLLLKNAKLLEATSELYIDIANIKGSVYIEDLVCRGQLRILNTKIGDQLMASRATFNSTADMTGIAVTGNLHLDGIQSSFPGYSNKPPIAAIELGHISVGGSIYLAGANLQGKPKSLSLANATVAGSVDLNAGFHSLGSVNLWQAVIKQNLNVVNADLAELDCSGAQIGELDWQGIVFPKNTKLRLVRSNIKNFQDVRNSWPSKGNLSVDGFVYEQMALEVPPAVPDLLGKTRWKGGGTSPEDRVSWLKLQRDEELGVSQPWLQLAQFVQARGNPSGAKEVLYTMRRIQAKNRGSVQRSMSFLYDFVEQNPLNITFPIALLWIFGSVIFWRAHRMKAMAPTDKDAYDYFTDHKSQPPSHVPFNSIAYALENVLPVVNLGQDDAWTPDPQTQSRRRGGWKRYLPKMSYRWLVLVRWLLIVLGWVLALILAGAIGERFKS